ncbi:MAG: Chromosome (plasmid) partitioning protein ParA [Cytophagales bacterium]|jgi:predicted DNA-binding transcriptional regulator YafY|nr:MAG: Chromosome (plasmid) partitioning protein ParA [Cytophagales bacterium]
MANYKGLRRYYLIIEKLQEGKNTSFKSIAKHLSANDIEISERTLQRDIAQIRADFGVDIIYDKSSNGYSIDETSSTNLPSFYRFLELTLTTELLREQLKEKHTLLNHIQFEPIESLKGHENLKLILDAILLKRWIKFQYTRFDEGITKTHEAIPCLLKRYQNRWYLIAKVKSGREVTYGIDRMSGLKKMTAVFKEQDLVFPEGLNSVVGLNYTGEPVRVVLEADELQAKYLLSLPLHHSQKVLSSSKKTIRFEYLLIPNFELMQAILKLGDQVKVIEPKELKDEIVAALKRTLQMYR